MRLGYSVLLGSLAGMVAAALSTPTPLALPVISGPSPKGSKVARKLRSRVHLNRSRKWDYAATYADARSISPFPERPVR